MRDAMKAPIMGINSDTSSINRTTLSLAFSVALMACLKLAICSPTEGVVKLSPLVVVWSGPAVVAGAGRERIGREVVGSLGRGWVGGAGSSSNEAAPVHAISAGLQWVLMHSWQEGFCWLIRHGKKQLSRPHSVASPRHEKHSLLAYWPYAATSPLVVPAPEPKFLAEMN